MTSLYEPDSIGPQDENTMLLSGHEINLSDRCFQDEEKCLYGTTVYLDKGTFQALLKMHYTKFVLIVIRVQEEGRQLLRRYTWNYKQIQSASASESNKNRLLIRVKTPIDGRPTDLKERDLDILFSSKLECDQFAYRFRMLKKIYKSSQESQAAVSPPQLPPVRSSTLIRKLVLARLQAKQKSQTTIPKTLMEPIDDLFSIDNLKKLAGATIKPVEPIIQRISISQDNPSL